ncbi:hypothetical protein [Bacteroides sp.]|uniref:hypothetical protein n=1 Tax=Bacteroides sp. TaxID=29523 RepID=UPI003A9562D3
MKMINLFGSICLFLLSSCTDSIDYSKFIGEVKPEEPLIQEALKTYTWPVEGGQAKLSEHYQVFVTLEGGEEKEIQVLQSDPIVQKLNTNGTMGEDYQAAYTKQRSFSFVNVSYDPAQGKKLTFRVKSLSCSSDGVELAPKSYGLSADSNGEEAFFMVDKANRYIIVNFDCPENIIDYPVPGPDGVTNHYNWIKNMLCIFVDPVEKPIADLSMKKVAYFTPQVTAEQLKTADVIYFRPGYYNLKGMNLPGAIEPIGRLLMQNNQQIYIEGGAFVEGVIGRVNYGDTNQGVRGRGILTGRQYMWEPGNNNRKIANLINAGNHATFEGIMCMESPHHGIVPTNDCLFENVKFLGWHCNNDGFRPGNNTKIRNCFIRAYDDFFYNYALDIQNCVLWPGFNGSIMTYGWQHYDIGGSTMEDIDIVYPEWKGMGNNCGLIMSQNEFRFEAKGRTVLRNIRIEGPVPGFVNLKPNSNYDDPETVEANPGKYGPVPAAELGFLGDLLMENIEVHSQVGEKARGMKTNLLKGARGEHVVANNPNAVWWVRDVTFKNVTINGVKLTEMNKDEYFNIDPETTQNILFE